MTTGPRSGGGPGARPDTGYPRSATIDWVGREDIEVSIAFRNAAALRLVLTRLADEANGLGIALEATLHYREENELRVGAYPAENRGCLGIAPREAFDTAGNLLASPTVWALGPLWAPTTGWPRSGNLWPSEPVVYPTLWALGPPGEEGCIDFYLDPWSCPVRLSLELCPPLDDVFRLVEEYIETGYLPRWVEWGRLTPGPKMWVAARR
jgi:hypothetical protein